MFRSVKIQTSRVLACILTLAIMLTAIPLSSFVTASAVTVENFTVNLPEGITGKVEATDEADSEAAPIVADLVDGTAKLGGLDDEKTYTIKITGMENYKDYTQANVVPSAETPLTVEVTSLVEKDAQTIAFAETSFAKKYADEAFVLTFTDSGLGTGEVTYTSSAETVATVDANGKVTIKGVGTTELKAVKASDGQYKSAEAVATLTVEQADGAIAYTATAVDWAYGSKNTNALTVKDGATGTIAYESDNPDVAEVDAETGEVTVLGNEGSTATITATFTADTTSVYANSSASYTVTVIKQENALVYTETEINVTYGDENGKNDTLVPTDVTGTITYTSNNEAVATVNGETGEYTIVGAGEATITATLGDDDLKYAGTTASYTLVVAKAEITGVEATGYSDTYDKNSHDAITSVTGTIEGVDDVTYSKEEKGTYLEKNPQVTNVLDSGTYYVKIHRNDNYKDLIIPVQVTIEKSKQEIKFGTTDDITYNVQNTFKYEIVEKSAGEDSKGAITYEIIEGTDIASINENNAIVTYTKVGTVKVKATIADCDNYLAATAEYTVEIKYIDTPEYSVTDPAYTDGTVKWYNSDVVISAEGWQVVEGTNAVDATEWKESITKPDEGAYNFQVSFKDEKGHITDLVTIDNIAIDKTAPTEKNQVSVVLEKKNDSTVGKVINFLTFGLFSNDSVKITVTADDEAKTENAPNSGVAKIQLFKYTVDGSREEVASVSDETNNVFIVEPDFEGTFKVLVTDNVGNTLGKQLLTKLNSNIGTGSGYTMLETTLPDVSDIAANSKKSTVEEYNDIFSGDALLVFTAQDTGSGLYSVEITVNGNAYTGLTESEPVTFKDGKDTNKYYYNLTTANCTPNDKGEFNFKVVVTDNAGNVTTKEKTVYVDKTAPVITDFKFETANEAVDENQNIIVDDYGFYFKDDTTVTITAQDFQTENETSSDVKAIVYKAVDITNGTVVSGEIAVDEGADDSKKDSIDFTLPANFKGQIYAYAIDNVGNSPLDVKIHEDHINDIGYINNENDENYGYKYPSGSIVESSVKHSETSSIEINASEKTATQNEAYAYAYSGSAQKDATMSYDDAQNVPLYAANPTFDITVNDSYSGIREVKVNVIENNTKTEVSKLNVENNGTLDNTGWKICENGTDDNLVTSVSTSVTVDGNFNNMVLLVELTDRAGNTSYDYYVFGIDKTAPTITVEYDNNNPDSEYTTYYKAKRTATVTITERNFDAKDVEFSITNTDEVIPSIDLKDASVWTETVDETNPDNTKYVATFTYENDGDYDFEINYTDLATNKAEGYSDSFTIDKTLPAVSVAYDNNDAQNGNYYKAERTATITIVEHNFDASRVNVIGVATDNGVPSTFPVTSAWVSNGNVHTATISYTADSKYSFDIEFKDMADNSIADYTPEEFYVDKTAPSLDITNYKIASNDVVAPVITYSDTNFNIDNVTVTLTGVNNGRVNYKHTIADIENGQTYTFADFERIELVDDIYTLTVTLTDMAGNETTKSIRFSANRFGSVYDLTGIKDMLGKYLQEEKDIVFTETNVDTLNEGETIIKLIKNGTPTDLVEGKDYTVTMVGGDGEWCVYTYTINKSLFATDGRYSLNVYSVDEAKNINENIDEAKAAEISFGIDKTKPVIVPIDLESGEQYAVENKAVAIEIKDNLVLENVKIYLNGEEVKYTVEGETYKFNVAESNSEQTVKVVATDAAGNEYVLTVEEFLVSTNFFVRWYNNTPLFIGSIAGVVVVALGITAFILFGKKKKKEEE